MSSHVSSILATIFLIVIFASLTILHPIAQDDSDIYSGAEVILALNNALQAGDMEAIEALFSDGALLNFGEQGSNRGKTSNISHLFDIFAELMSAENIDIYPVAVSEDGTQVVTEMRVWTEPFTSLELGAAKMTQLITLSDDKIDDVFWFTDATASSKYLVDMMEFPMMPDMLVGEWLCEDCAAMVNYQDDGTYIRYDYFGQLIPEPVTDGTYTLENGVLTTTDTTFGCEVKTQLRMLPGWTYDMQLIEKSDRNCSPPDMLRYFWHPYVSPDE